MRHIMRGALGVAVVYPLLWHYSSKDVGAPLANAAAAPMERRGNERPPAEPAGAEERAPAGAMQAVTERLPAPAARQPASVAEPRAPEPVAARAPEPVAARAPVAPQQPSVPEPGDPLVALGQVPELKETLARAAEIQQHAANPAELERAVQGLDEDPAKLARLKALADLLVQLPPPRDPYLPASGRSTAGPASR